MHSLATQRKASINEDSQKGLFDVESIIRKNPSVSSPSNRFGVTTVPSLSPCRELRAPKPILLSARLGGRKYFVFYRPLLKRTSFRVLSLILRSSQVPFSIALAPVEILKFNF
ncbi:hypothetical protein K1719_025520 [Acacia pycnantha]|nr:hypothetical protein K1719_025520 [Acacia pycnantha]